MAELEPRLGLFQVTMYGVGLILGAGIYVLVGQAAALAGDLVWASFLLAAGVALFTGLSYAELSAMYPKSAAEYVYVRKAFGSPFFAYLVGWLIVFAAVVSAATVALGFGGYLASLAGLPAIGSAILLIAVLSVVNFIGVRESSWVNIIFTIVEAAGLVLIVVLGLTYGSPRPVRYLAAPMGLDGVFAAVALSLFAFIGFENIANIAEETKDPSRVLPRSFLLSILITAVAYTLVALSIVRVLDGAALGRSGAPLADVAGAVLGPGGGVALSAVALFATSNTVLVLLVASSRILYGMAEQGSIPKALGRIHPRTHTPAIAVVTVMAIAIVFALVGDITVVANLSIFAIVFTFAVVNLAVIWLRYRQPDSPRPFRVPLHVGRFPVVAGLGLLTSVIGLLRFDLPTAAVGLGVVGVASLAYSVSPRAHRPTNGPGRLQS